MTSTPKPKQPKPSAAQKTGANLTQPLEDESAKLKPLMFLKGSWRGDGLGPYGPYKLETHVEQRGRWMLMTSAIIDPKSHETTYVSTQVYGYGTDGLQLQFFDTAGSFEFHGMETKNLSVNKIQCLSMRDVRVRRKHGKTESMGSHR